MKRLFYHAYDAYMAHAYPSDELLPLSCRGTEATATEHGTPQPVATGDWSRTLIDALDTLYVLGEWADFEHAVGLVQRDFRPVPLDGASVSLFESTIRVLGGLLSAHIIAARNAGRFNPAAPYRGQLLAHAEAVAQALMPAFDTPTGIPCSTVSSSAASWECLFAETTPADAGTLLLEWRTLARLTGKEVYSKYVDRALKVLRTTRSRLGLYSEWISWSNLKKKCASSVLPRTEREESNRKTACWK